MYWFYVLPLGFLLTMYTITGYDASAHISEETHGAAMAAPKGVWRSVFYSAVFGWMVLLALTFAATHVKDDQRGRRHVAVDHRDRAHLGRGQGGARDLDRRPAVLRHGMRHERVADDVRVLTRRRGPGPQPVAAARQQPDADAGRSCSCAVCAFIITIPAYKGNHAGLPVAFLAVTSISVIGLYIAYTIPVFLRWRMGDKFAAGPWTLGAKYKWINLIAIVWVALCVIIFCLPFTPAAVPFSSQFSWSAFNYAPTGHDRRDAAVTIWYLTLGTTHVQGTDPHDRRLGSSGRPRPPRRLRRRARRAT